MAGRELHLNDISGALWSVKGSRAFPALGLPTSFLIHGMKIGPLLQETNQRLQMVKTELNLIFSREGFCRNPRGIFLNEFLGEFCRGFLCGFFGAFFIGKKGGKKSTPKIHGKNQIRIWEFRGQNPHCKNRPLKYSHVRGPRTGSLGQSWLDLRVRGGPTLGLRGPTTISFWRDVGQTFGAQNTDPTTTFQPPILAL